MSRRDVPHNLEWWSHRLAQLGVTLSPSILSKHVTGQLAPELKAVSGLNIHTNVSENVVYTGAMISFLFDLDDVDEFHIVGYPLVAALELIVTDDPDDD